MEIQGRRLESGWKRIFKRTPLSLLRVETALKALQQGKGVLVSDDEDRENEADLIFAAQSVTEKQMAMLIRECSGIDAFA